MKSDPDPSPQQENPETAGKETTSAQGQSVLPEAINLTLRTIERRTRLYRNLLVVVSLVSITSCMAAMLTRRGLPLAGLILVVPLAGGFLFLDSRRVRLWRTAVMEMCRQRGLVIADFLQTISQFKHVPPGALHTMLATLSAEGPGGPRRLEGTMLARNTSEPASRNEEWKILAATIVFALALVGVAAAAFWNSMWPLLLTAGLAVVAAFLRRK